MSIRSEEDLRYLRDAYSQGALIPFVGAGLSVAAAGLPTWPELLDLGLRFAIDECGVDPLDPRLQGARESQAAGNLIDAFAQMQEVLLTPQTGLPASPVYYCALLAQIFSNPNVISTDLLEALQFLQPRRLLTTNYDLLLEDFGVCGPDSFTWEQPAEIRRMFRLGTGLVHLHGRWDRPSSVIMSKADYDRVVASQPTAAIAEAIFHSGVLLFIGTSLDGTHDPHLADLLSRFESLADRAKGETAPHVMLLRAPIDGLRIARLQAQGIRAVEFGTDHNELPVFLRSIADTDHVQIRARLVDQLLSTVSRCLSLDDALREIARWIDLEVFNGRTIRVAFSEKRSEGGTTFLQQRAVIPRNSSGNPHNYPLSIAAWALLEGRVISWPHERTVRVNFAWLERLRKLGPVATELASFRMDNLPEVRRYLSIETVRQRFRDQTLTLGDFYQDWVTDQPRAQYVQFLSVPVPMLEQVPNRSDIPELGVFNIDTEDSRPLLDRRVNELLRVASAVTLIAFRIFAGPAGLRNEFRQDPPSASRTLLGRLFRR